MHRDSKRFGKVVVQWNSFRNRWFWIIDDKGDTYADAEVALDPSEIDFVDDAQLRSDIIEAHTWANAENKRMNDEQRQALDNDDFTRQDEIDEWNGHYQDSISVR